MAILVVVIGACGGKESVAERSATAFAEAQKKGVPVGPAGHEHGATPDHSTMDHSTMDHSKPMDHSTMDHSKPMDHSTMDHSKPMDHSTMDHSKPMDHSTMDHSTMTGMNHGSSAAPATLDTAAPRSNAEMKQVAPAETLRSDPLDAPAPAAVSEAAKASGKKDH